MAPGATAAFPPPDPVPGTDARGSAQARDRLAGNTKCPNCRPITVKI
jgi:hypothetical protein